MKKISLLVILAVLYIHSAKAQYFQTGQDPSSISWRQINTENFQIIYPEEFEKQAQRVSFVLEKVYDYGSKTLEFPPRKISVVLHTRTVNSNGLVGWAPKRIELFTTPHQQIYAQDWLEELALHEFRHVVQMDKIQSELPVLVKAILGEQATAIVVGAYLPFWFLEGDAVVTETALSNSGRGRMASFSMDYRAQLIEKRAYSFDKAYLGSYKDYVPDHYQLGYWMVGKSREKYGAEIWADALQKVGQQPFSLTPLNSSMKQSTGLSTKQMYSDIFQNLTEDWTQSLASRTIDSITVLSPAKKIYTQYLYPEIFRDSILFAYRTSIADIGRFVLVNPDQTEKVIYTPGTIFEESVSMKDNLIIWAERRADLRWTHSERSVILVYNMESKIKHEIKPENKLFSPVISPDLKSFAAVEVDPENNIFLSVFDLETGRLKYRFNTPDNQYFFTPCWDEKGEKLYVVALSSKGKYLASVDIKTKQFQSLTVNTFANLKNPVYSKGQIFFSSDFSGVDNLYSLDTESEKITQIASVSFGADYPSVSDSENQLIFSNYTSSGYQLGAIQLPGKNTSKEVTSIQLETNTLAENLASQEKGVPDFANADSVVYATKKYSKLGHLFNFHSWAPAYIDVNSYEIRPGFSLLSQNKLGTAETILGYDYNVADRTGRYKLAFNYLGWYPEIKTEISAGNEASNYYQINNTVNQNNEVISSDTTIQRFTWREVRADVDVRLPLNLSKGKFSRILYPEVNYSLKNISGTDSTLTELYPGSYHAMTYRLYYYNLLHQSVLSIMPRWGQMFDLIYRHTPFTGSDLGTLSGAQSIFYFPGLTKNSGLKIYQGYQEKNFTSYSFSDFIRFPRGFQSSLNNKMYSLAADYKFPVFYPDFSIGKLAYIKRLKASLFYDYAWLSVPKIENHKIYSNDHVVEMKSFGVEMTSDLHVLRFFAPVEIGFRTTYRPDYGDFQFNLLLSTDFSGF
ncbi:MAG TPA: hypothetical protein VFC65_15660 [Prolixibacteraceae bacterium]|nr:hypothetical protein [Prolixibacteraceae bacterium]